MKTHNRLKSILGMAIISVLLPIMYCDSDNSNPPELAERWVHERIGV